MLTFALASLSLFQTRRTPKSARRATPKPLLVPGKAVSFTRRTEGSTARQRQTSQTAAAPLESEVPVKKKKKRDRGLWSFLKGRPRASWIGLISEKLDSVRRKIDLHSLDLETAPDSYLLAEASHGTDETCGEHLRRLVARLKSDRFELATRLAELRRAAKHKQTATFHGKPHGHTPFLPVIMNGKIMCAPDELVVGMPRHRMKATKEEVAATRKAAAKRKKRELREVKVLLGGCGANGRGLLIDPSSVTVPAEPEPLVLPDAHPPQFEVFRIKGRLPSTAHDKLASARRGTTIETRRSRIAKANALKVGVDRFTRSKHHRRGAPMSPKLDGVAFIAFCAQLADEADKLRRAEQAAAIAAYEALVDRFLCPGLPFVEPVEEVEEVEEERSFDDFEHLYDLPWSDFEDGDHSRHFEEAQEEDWATDVKVKATLAELDATADVHDAQPACV